MNEWRPLPSIQEGLSGVSRGKKVNKEVGMRLLTVVLTLSISSTAYALPRFVYDYSSMPLNERCLNAAGPGTVVNGSFMSQGLPSSRVQELCQTIKSKFSTRCMYYVNKVNYSHNTVSHGHKVHYRRGLTESEVAACLRIQSEEGAECVHSKLGDGDGVTQNPDHSGVILTCR
jgi:hypothetical protein